MGDGALQNIVGRLEPSRIRLAVFVVRPPKPDEGLGLVDLAPECRGHGPGASQIGVELVGEQAGFTTGNAPE